VIHPYFTLFVKTLTVGISGDYKTSAELNDWHILNHTFKGGSLPLAIDSSSR
jgi:hypothetical protein